MQHTFHKLLAGLCLLLFIAGTKVHAQAWRSAGPDNYGGRIRALAFSPDGANLFAGAAGGGLWVTTNLGLSWKPVDAYNVAAKGNQGITCIAVKGNTLYVATGPLMYHKDEFGSPYQVITGQLSQFPFLNTDGFLGDAEKPGGGIYLSEDGGATWRNAPATNPKGDVTSPYIAIQHLCFSGDRILVATWKGLFYSDDNLKTMTAVADPLLGTAAILDVEAGAGEVVFAGTHQDLYRSPDRGTTFTRIPPKALGVSNSANFGTNGLKIAIAPGNREVVYAADIRASGTLGGVYASADNGLTWKLFAGPETGGFDPLANGIGAYACLLEVSPFQEKEVYLAGNNWFTYSSAEGWLQTAQHTNPNAAVQFGSRPYLPAPLFCMAWHPTDAGTYFVGTGEGVYTTTDGGLHYADRSAGLEASLVYAVNSTGQDTLHGGVHGVYGSFPDHGLMLNTGYDRDSRIPGFSNHQGFGQLVAVSTNTREGRAKGMIGTSVTHPGAVMIQHTDYGLTRSTDFGKTFNTFYGTPAIPNERAIGLTVVNTYKVYEKPCQPASPTNDLARVDTLVWIDRETPCNQGGTLYSAQVPEKEGGQVIPFVVDEQLADSVVAAWVGVRVNPVSGRDSIVSSIGWEKDSAGLAPGGAKLYEKERLLQQEAFAFFCSKDYVWRIDHPFNSPPEQLPRWTRLTDNLTRPGEFFTAIAVANDASHAVYVGTNRGNLWRITGAHDLSTYHAETDVVQLNLPAHPDAPFNIDAMTGYTVTDIAVDPRNPGRVAVSFTGGNARQKTLPGGGAYSYLWVSDAMQSKPFVPQFSNVSLTDAAGNDLNSTTINALAWVENPDPAATRSILLMGTESGLYLSKDPGTDEFAGIDPALSTAYVVCVQELGASTPGFGEIPVTDIHVQRHKTVILSEETGNYTAMRDNTIFVATYGRGIWMNDAYAPANRVVSPVAEASAAVAAAWVFPNPATESATLRLTLAEEAETTVTLFDMAGKADETILSTLLAAGEHTTTLLTSRLEAGMYLIRIQSGNYHQTLKLVVAR